MSDAPLDRNRTHGIIVLDTVGSTPLAVSGINFSGLGAAMVAIVDGSGNQITSFGGTPITNYSLETGGNLATIAGKDFATQTTLALIKAKTDNLDVLLSTRTKPADTQIISGVVTTTLNAETTKVIGTVNQGTSPWVVSGTVSTGLTQPLTDTQLRATPVPVSGTVNPTTPTVTVAFVTAVTTAGTRVQLGANSVVAGILQAPSTNSGIIYVGGSNVSNTVYGAELQPGQATGFAIDNTNKIYIDSSVNGDKCAFLGS